MAQYRTGVVAVSTGNPVVLGTGTLWLSNVSVGDLFVLSDIPTVYTVLSVAADDELTLSVPWAGDNETNALYGITRDFSPNRGYPLIQRQDIETASIVKRALIQIDSDQGAQLYIAAEDSDSVTIETGTL